MSCLLMSFSFMVDNPSFLRALLAGEVFLNLPSCCFSPDCFQSVHIFSEVRCPKTRWDALAKALSCWPEQKSWSTWFTGWTHIFVARDICPLFVAMSCSWLKFSLQSTSTPSIISWGTVESYSPSLSLLNRDIFFRHFPHFAKIKIQTCL